MTNFRWRQPLIALFALMYSTASHAGFFVGVSVGIAPPPLPVYAQPICPGPDLIWTPGYWAYDPDVDDYYWVPGTWLRAPVVGYLWTPGYWGWSDGYYAWHAGYWGPHIGFYGGINYGFGYIGEGYHGGHWDNGAFVYNTAVTNVNTTIIHNTYNETVVVNHTTVNNVSFNGGSGGIAAQPTAQEKLAATEQHVGLTQQQTEHEHGASQNRELRASFNHGNPTIAATSHAAVFTGPGVVPAKGLTTGPKSTGTLGNPALGSTPPGSPHSQNPANAAKTVAHTPPNGLMTGPKNTGLPVTNPGLGPTPPGSLQAKHPDNGATTFAHAPPNGFTTGPKNHGQVMNPALGLAPPGSLHPKQPQNGPKVFAQPPPGKIVGANGRPPAKPQANQAHGHPQDKKPPKDEH